MENQITPNNVEKQIFESTQFQPKDLENLLWETMGKVADGKMKVEQANSIFFGVRDLCLIAKLRLQYRVLSGSHIIDRSDAVKKVEISATRQGFSVTQPRIAQQESRSNLKRSHKSHLQQLKKMKG